MIPQTLTSFELHLYAEGKSPKTVRTYTDAIRKLARDQDLTDLADCTRQHIERHIIQLLREHSAAYASNQGRALQQAFRWWAAEEDLPNPMAGVKLPQVVPPVVPVLTKEQLDGLLAVCRGRAWKARRDAAIILLFRDSGMRLAELAGLADADVDLRQREALVTGKGNRQRVTKFGAEAARAIDRYLRVRPAMGGSLFGLQASGVYQAVARRGQQAGVRVHPHQLRHTFAHTWLDRGGAEGDLQELAGWRSPQMLRRYGASAASSRARRSYDRVMNS